MASAQVGLGLMPTILSLIGPSYEELALLACIGRRPLLALLLFIGSPSPYLSRAFEFKDPAVVLRLRRGERSINLLQNQRTRLAVAMLQYLVAVAVVANVGTPTYDLGVKAVCSLMSDLTTMPLIWSMGALLINISGVVVVLLRAQPVVAIPAPSAPHENLTMIDNLLIQAAYIARRLYEVACREHMPCVSQKDLRVRVFPECKTYLGLAWVLSTATVVLLVFGTIGFASVPFIGPQNARAVVARYAISAVACRAVVMYELAGLRQNVKIIHVVDKIDNTAEVAQL